ncbi:alpha/beta fold hydrolase [Paenibacillus sp. NPDC058071]|uniref:alpha/beta fold hydrolase n=1 Tax=Paenibacillus sp. NPDC058071 TaxID=3346326 RepID=UPI0036DB494D
MIQDYIDVSGGRIFYTVSGSGDPLILIHGNFNDHQIWNEQVDSLAAQYKVIRYDLRGYGLSSTPTAPFSNVDDLKALVDSLKLQNVTLVGSSLGGSVAVNFTLAYPGLVNALILVSPSINGRSYPMKMMWEGIRNFINTRLKGREKAIEAFIANPFWQYFFPSAGKDEARNKVLHNVRNSSNFCRFSPNLSTVIKPYAFNRLQEINIPILTIISDQDHPFNITTAESLHAKMNRSFKTMMQGCGHLPFIEEPQLFNQHILDFLGSKPKSVHDLK